MIDKLILASGSPRRKEILGKVVKNLIILPQDVEELYTATLPEEIVIQLAKIKLGTLAQEYFSVPVVSADTIVWFNGVPLGKPKDIENAKKMLLSLSGNEHQVYTGFAIAYKGRIYTDYERSDIVFKNLTEDEIDSYVASGSPMDKAGGYGIQDGVTVKSFSGDLQNIIGFPLDKFLILYNNIVKQY